MRAIGSGPNDVRRAGVAQVGVLLCCAFLTYIAMSTGAKAHDAGEGPTTIAGCKQKYPKHDTDQAACILRVHLSQSKCTVYPFPCIGHIVSVYAMDGLGGGDTKLLWATFGKGIIGEGVREGAHIGNPEKQPIVWRSVPSVKIVAVFIVHMGDHANTLQRIPTGPHSGHVTLKWFRQARQPTGPDAGPPRLILEGTRIR